MNEAELAKARKRQTKNVFSSINFAVYTKRPNIFARLSKIAGFFLLLTLINYNRMKYKISTKTIYRTVII